MNLEVYVQQLLNSNEELLMETEPAFSYMVTVGGEIDE